MNDSSSMTAPVTGGHRSRPRVPMRRPGAPRMARNAKERACPNPST